MRPNGEKGMNIQMKTIKKTGVRILFVCLLSLGLWYAEKMTGKAAETKEQVLMQLEADTDVYEEANEESIVIATIPKGTGVICSETESAQWYAVSYQEIKGYVQAKAVGLYGDTEELAEEFEEIHEENSAQAEAVEESERQEKSQLFWGGIMALLVVLMLATGIYTALRGRNKAAGGTREKKTKED